jgi:hypothetical protein
MVVSFPKVEPFKNRNRQTAIAVRQNNLLILNGQYEKNKIHRTADCCNDKAT